MPIVLNIAEGAGRFYAIARGSATECAAIVDIVIGRGLATAPACQQARSLLVRIVQMLTRLNARMAVSN